MPETTTIENIEAAVDLAKKYLIKTPLVYSPEFSEATGNDVYFKLESLQRTHAFKARGALNRVASLSSRQREHGVIAASSGNHALGVAYASSVMGGRATVVMPVGAPATKVDLAKRYGARVILHGHTYDDALAHATRLAREQKMALLPSFDDDKVIAGQGTIALEVIDELPDVGLFVVPIGGGGLISGLAVALDSVDHPAKLVGVEAEGAASMLLSLRAGERVKIAEIETIADGIAVQQPGRRNLALVQHYAPDVITVSDDQILDGMARMLRDMRIVVEPAAAAAPAALLFHKALQNRDLRVCCVVSGANISQEVLERTIALVSSGIPLQPRAE